jgi:Replicative DNA helicase
MIYDADSTSIVTETPAISARMEIERALVGGLIIHPELIDGVAAVVRLVDIADIAAQTVYSCLRDMAIAGQHINEVLAAKELKDRKEFDAIGGYSVFGEMISYDHNAADIMAYADEVRKAAAATERLGAVAAAYGDLVDDGADSDAICSDLVARLSQIERGDLRHLEALTAREILKECLDPGKLAAFIATGYSSIDDLHGGGLAIPSLTVIGAAPSMGKTQLANNLVTRMQKTGKPARVLYLSLEMGRSEMASRFIAMLGGIDLGLVKVIQYGRAPDHVEQMHGPAFDKGAELFADLPLSMFTGGLDADGVREFAARYSGRYDVLILDYLQRVSGKGNQKALERVEAASRACKDIAVQHDVAVITLASLSREGYRDKSAKPDLAHLRECGSIEFDADNVWMLWRNKDDPLARNDLELHVRKQRNGPLDTLHFDFNLHTGRIFEQAGETF